MSSNLTPSQRSSRRKTMFYNASNYDSLVKEMRLYQVVLLGTEYVESTTIGEKPYTTYRLRVSHQNGTKWTTTRRYREFRSLMETLKKRYGSTVPHGFPPKKILRNMNPLLIDKRHMALQTWIDKVLQQIKLGSCPEVQLFLEEHKMDEGLVEVQFEDSMVKIDLEKIGYLFKLHNKQWKKRWFILRHGILYKYNSHEDKYPYGQYVWRHPTVERLEMDVAGPSSKDPKQFSFIVTHKRKQHVFSASSEEEMEEWMAAIAGEEDEKLYGDVESKGKAKILGVPLEDIEHKNNEGLPIFLTCLMDYLEATAKGEKDLFTQAPDPILISQIQEGELDFELIKNHHAVAGLIQVFLHEMPLPVLTFELRACFIGSCDVLASETQIAILHALCSVLPSLHFNLLRRLCFFLNSLAAHGDEEFFDHLCNTFSVLILRSPKEKEKEEMEMKNSFALSLTEEKSKMNQITKALISNCELICPTPLKIDNVIDIEDELDLFIESNTPRVHSKKLLESSSDVEDRGSLVGSSSDLQLEESKITSGSSSDMNEESPIMEELLISPRRKTRKNRAKKTKTPRGDAAGEVSSIIPRRKKTKRAESDSTTSSQKKKRKRGKSLCEPENQDDSKAKKGKTKKKKEEAATTKITSPVPTEDDKEDLLDAKQENKGEEATFQEKEQKEKENELVKENPQDEMEENKAEDTKSLDEEEKEEIVKENQPKELHEPSSEEKEQEKSLDKPEIIENQVETQVKQAEQEEENKSCSEEKEPEEEILNKEVEVFKDEGRSNEKQQEEEEVNDKEDIAEKEATSTLEEETVGEEFKEEQEDKISSNEQVESQPQQSQQEDIDDANALNNQDTQSPISKKPQQDEESKETQEEQKQLDPKEEEKSKKEEENQEESQKIEEEKENETLKELKDEQDDKKSSNEQVESQPQQEEKEKNGEDKEVGEEYKESSPLEEEEESESQSAEGDFKPPTPMDLIPKLNLKMLNSDASKTKAQGRPGGRRPPTRRLKPQIAIEKQTFPDKEKELPKANVPIHIPRAAPKPMSPEQQMMLEMSRLFKRKQ